MSDWGAKELELLRSGLLAIDGQTGQTVVCRPEKRRLFAALYGAPVPVSRRQADSSTAPDMIVPLPRRVP